MTRRDDIGAAVVPFSGRTCSTFADGQEEMLVGGAVLESSRTIRWVQVARTGGAAAADRPTSVEVQSR